MLQKTTVPMLTTLFVHPGVLGFNVLKMENTEKDGLCTMVLAEMLAFVTLLKADAESDLV